MKISVANNRFTKKWKNTEITYLELKGRCQTTIRTTETVEEYKKMKKAQRDDVKDVGGLVGGHLANGSRKKGSVLSRSMGTMDLDYASADVIDVIRSANVKSFLYSTHSHTPENPRYRWFYEFTRDVTPEEYEAVTRMVAKEIGIDYFDDTTYEPNRLMYWPSTPSNGEFIFEEFDGEKVNPDEYLAKYDDWKDVSTWPTSSRQSEVIKSNVKKQADPLGKDGIVGTFCRTYIIHEAISLFLSDIYEPSAMEGRYDYIPADSSAGVEIFEDRFAYSHHATDPASGKLLNSWDIVRIHMFGDEKSSFNDMAEFVVSLDKIKDALLKEKQAKAEKEFDDWKEGLEYEARSTVLKNNLHNLTLILENDKSLKNIVFNQQSDGMEIKGSVPWKHPSKHWRDADDAQLVSYIDKNYGTFSQRNYQIAVTKVVDDRSYHPIKEFLQELPTWDRVERVDTLFIDYLGADDNEYTRAVTRKTLCAAVKRVKFPGCKFDSMLVLNGPQGIGKSTLISKLAGDWFSDSLSLSDTKDKTAAEKLQGYWILEIGELAGLRKAEVETLRSFLSRQNDIYRAAFGKRATPHQRQCIFFGTTNAETGYLRDITGNRRFWPVRTGKGNKKSWELTIEDVKQIWAEVLFYVDCGECLYLDNNLAELAASEQRSAMEVDEREGLIKEYLDALLPENWSDMSIYDRRNFLNGSEFGVSESKGVLLRNKVSTMEIWCECLGKDRANLNRMESNAIISILLKLGWEKQEKKERTIHYGPQNIYVPKECT